MATFSLPNYIFGSAHRQAEEECALAYKANGVYTGITHGELRTSVEHFAKALAESGVHKSEPVCLLAKNCPEWVIADLGIMLAGGVSVPIQTEFHEESMVHILGQTQASTLIVASEFLIKILFIKDRLLHVKRIIVFQPAHIREVLDNGNSVPVEHDFARLSEEYHLQIEGFSEMLMAGRDSLCELYKRHFECDDPASIVYTSGTTGMPKGVVLTHRNFISNIQDVQDYVPVFQEDVFLSILPLSHVFERTGGCFIPLSCGAAIYFADGPKMLAQNFKEVQPTVFIGVPRIYEKFYEAIQERVQSGFFLRKWLFLKAFRYLRNNHDLERNFMVAYRTPLKRKIIDALVSRKIRASFGGRLRVAIVGGAKLSKRVSRFFHIFGVNLLEGYGLTETSPIICCNRFDNAKLGTVGLPLRSVSVVLAEDGEILVKGQNVMKGYYQDERKTREAFDSDGWFQTGDIGRFDASGFLTITGRKKEIIITSGGKNIFPSVLEHALVTGSELIAQAAVCGEGKKFISAVIVPNMRTVVRAAKSMGIPRAVPHILLDYSLIRALFDEEIKHALAHCASYEQVKKFILVDEQFTVENDLLTSTLKLKRNNIFKHYQSEIEALYE
jgi:long-chain acyl-CoA synthetase